MTSDKHNFSYLGLRGRKEKKKRKKERLISFLHTKQSSIIFFQNKTSNEPVPSDVADECSCHPASVGGSSPQGSAGAERGDGSFAGTRSQPCCVCVAPGSSEPLSPFLSPCRLRAFQSHPICHSSSIPSASGSGNLCSWGRGGTL